MVGVRASKPLNYLGISGTLLKLPESSSVVSGEVGFSVSEFLELGFGVLSWDGAVLLGACEDACVVVGVADGLAACWSFLPRNHQAPKARATTKIPVSAISRTLRFFFGGCGGVL